MAGDPHNLDPGNAARPRAGLDDQETAAMPAAPWRADGVDRQGPGVTGAPSKVGAYVVRRLLGEGGMGVVVEAEHERLGSLAAVKLMRGVGGEENPSAVARFVDEARVLAMLEHPAICRVFDAGTYPAPGGTGVRPYFAMELLEGARDVLSYAAAKGLGAAERVRLMLPILDAVEYGHDKGVLHRDLKPDNILVVEREGAGVAKLIDFGIARALGSQAVRARLTQAGAFLGTPRYASPEQFSGRSGQVDRRTDVYALGVVLHELVFGTHPYGLEGHDAFEAAEQMRRAGPLRAQRPEHRELETVIHTAVELDVSRRYQTVAALAADLRRWLAEEPVLAQRPSTVTLAARRARTLASRNRPLTRVLAVVAATLVAMLPPAPVRRGVEWLQEGWMRAMAPVWAGRASSDGVAVVTLSESSHVESLGPELGVGPVTTEPGPTWRRMHAKVIATLARAGVRAIAFDMSFAPQTGTPESDGEFAAAVDAARAQGVPVAVTAQDWSTADRGVLPAAWEGRMLWGPATLQQVPGFWLTDLAMSRKGVGEFPSMAASIVLASRAAAGQVPTPVVSIHADEQVVRIQSVAAAPGSVGAARRVEDVPAQIEVVGEDAGDGPEGTMGLMRSDQVAMLFCQPWPRRLAEAATFDYARVARGEPAALSFLKGRIVIIGRTGQEGELTTNPADGRDDWRVYGHAAAIATMLQRRYVRLPAEPAEWACVGLAAAMGGAGGCWPRRARGRAAALAGLTGLVLIGSVAAWFAGGWVVLAAQPVLALVLAGGLVWWLAPRAAR